MTEERVELYCNVPTSISSIPVYITPFPVEYSILVDADIEEAVKHLCLNRLGGPSVIHVEHLYQ